MKKVLLVLITGLFISTNVYSDHVPTKQKHLGKDPVLLKKIEKYKNITDWTYECKKGDFKKHVAIKEGCIGLLPLGKIDKSKKKLVVFLHGDRKNDSDYKIKESYPMSSAIKDEKKNINFFYLARPGHKFPGRKRSVGKETSGQQKGSWNAVYKKSWDQIRLSAEAIKKLKEHYEPDQLIAIGQSGGAQAIAITLGKIPGLIDKAILIGCPCLEGFPDRIRVPWESPANQIGHIDPKTEIILITGEKDSSTPAEWAETYAKRAKEQGLSVQLHIVKGSHDYKSLKGLSNIIKDALK